MNILLIEDEKRVSSLIKRGLEEEGHRVAQAFDGIEGLEEAANDCYDVIILDVLMPGMNGVEVCRRLRAEHQSQTPVLMLTALGATDDVVTGLESGADDYLVKPFKFRELTARLEALYRRSIKPKEKDEDILQVHDLIIKRNLKEVYRGGEEIKLTAREYRLLEFLLKNKNKVLSRPEILEKVWDVDFDLGTNVIDVYINYLRKKIDRGSPKSIIQTVIGTGYIIKD